MTTPEDIFARHITRSSREARPASVYAPANIALSKYWGKRDKALNLPLNSSLSISLGQLGTTTQIAPSDVDELVFKGDTLDPSSPFALKVWSFVDLFRGLDGPRLRIVSNNTIPTAAGLASSASGFAALAKALDQSLGTGLPDGTLSMLSRFGSGSATRSIWHGFVRWNRGDLADGTDSHAEPLNIDMPNLRIAIVPVDTGPKDQTSRDGMNHTVATSPLFASWPDRAEQDCRELEGLLAAGEFAKAGQLIEANALAMHATMMAARPSLVYLKAPSWSVLEDLWIARADGLAAFATMDAGANIKLVFKEGSVSDIAATFPTAQIINPFERNAP